MNHNAAPPHHAISAYRFVKTPPGAPFLDRNAFANAQLNVNHQWHLSRDDRPQLSQTNIPWRQPPQSPQTAGLPKIFMTPPRFSAPLFKPMESLPRLLQSSLPLVQNQFQNMINVSMGFSRQMGPQAEQTIARLLSFFYGNKKMQNTRDEKEKDDRDQFYLYTSYASGTGIIQQSGAPQSGSGGAK